MRPHLVRINSTVIALAPLVFNSILIVEILFCIIYLVMSPIFCVAVSRAGSIHRNIQWQLCLLSFVYSIGIYARFVLIYYQIFEIPLTDDDTVLMAADLVRDTVIGYVCGIAAALFSQTLIATYFWKWYESNNCSTFLVIVVTETVNLTLSFANAYISLLGYAPLIVNVGYLSIIVSCSVSGFLYTYINNARQLNSLTNWAISHTSYTVGRSFQIRENVQLMKYLVRCMVPAAVIATPCFICFGFNEYGPGDWILSRSIAFAMFDLFFVIFNVFCLYREITKHPLIFRKFKKLGLIQKFQKQVVHAESVSSISKIDFSPTNTYFDQFKDAWK